MPTGSYYLAALSHPLFRDRSRCARHDVVRSQLSDRLHHRCRQSKNVAVRTVSVDNDQSWVEAMLLRRVLRVADKPVRTMGIPGELFAACGAGVLAGFAR